MNGRDIKVEAGGAVAGWRRWGPMLALALLAFVPYLPALQNGILLWDDPCYLTQNYRVHYLNWANIADLFRLHPQRGQMPNAQYTPLVELSYMIEGRFFGSAPWIYHLDNVLLHVFNTLLVFFFVQRLTRKRLWAWLTAMLFAVHPLHVESVAWITERKDMLSGFFYLAALVFYLRYLDRASRRDYALAALAGIAAFLSKPLAVTLPAVMLLCAVFLKRAWDRKLLYPLLPLFVLSAVGSYISFYTHLIKGVAEKDELLAVGVNLLVAARGIALYFQNFLWPFRLSALYPLPPAGQPFGLDFHLALAALIVLCGALAYWGIKGRRPVLMFSLLFFLVVLLPSSRIIPVGMRFLAADRFFYLPGIGLFLLLGFGIFRLLQARPAWRWMAGGATAALCLAWGAGTWQRNRVWRDDETLWRDGLAKYPDSPTMLFMLAQTLVERDPEAANRLADRGLQLDPDDHYAFLVKPVLLQRAGDNKGCLEWLNKAEAADYNQALGLDIADIRGRAYSALGDHRQAILSYCAITTREPQAAPYYGLMALSALRMGEVENALACLETMRDLSSRQAAWQKLLAERVPAFSSLSELKQLICMNPDLMRQQYELARECHFVLKDHERAMKEYHLLLEFYPDVVDVWLAAGKLLPRAQQPPQVAEVRELHVRKLGVALYNQACLYALEGQAVEALAALRQALARDATLRENAAKDSDFTALKDNREFIELTREIITGKESSKLPLWAHAKARPL